ncbi:MAG: DUF523 domain-containing protein [Sedimenticola sp.]
MKIGVSSCLLGERVRYNGELKRSALIADGMADIFDFVAVCPEVEAGFPVPRPAVRLVGESQSPRALEVDNPLIDITAELALFSRQRAVGLEGICGYLFKAGSPSCGLDIALFDLSGKTVGRSRGIFARTVQENFPLLPVADERHMEDPVNGERFLLRVILYSYWRGVSVPGGSPGKLLRNWVETLYPGVRASPQIAAILRQRLRKPEDAEQLLRESTVSRWY